MTTPSPDAPIPRRDTLRRILLADDNADNQNLAMRRLERRGYQVTLAADGCEVLDHLERTRFDLVLMDVQMPRLDGFTAAAAVRAREKVIGGHVPIIALTALEAPDDIARSAAAGMDAHVPKPIRWPELFSIIDALLAGVPTPTALAQNTTGAPPPPVFDRAALRATFGDDRDLFRRVSDVFVAERPRRLADIRQAIVSGDALKAERQTHALRGALGTLCAFSATQAAARLEAIARTGALDSAEQAFSEMTAEIDAFISAMSEGD